MTDQDTCQHNAAHSEETIEEEPAHMHLMTYKCTDCNKVLLIRTVGCPTEETHNSPDSKAKTSSHCRKDE